jgi:hypothetical protein
VQKKAVTADLAVPTFTKNEAVKKALIELTKRGGKRGKLGA